MNPLAGCFPALVQVPVFLALYRSFLNLASEVRTHTPPPGPLSPPHPSPWAAPSPTPCPARWTGCATPLCTR